MPRPTTPPTLTPLTQVDIRFSDDETRDMAVMKAERLKKERTNVQD